jgi:hypothetical protein
MEVRGEQELRTPVPIAKFISLIERKSLCCGAGPMMTNEVKGIDLRENLRPQDPRYFVENFTFSLNLRRHLAEFRLYIHKMLDCLPVILRLALDEELLEEARHLPDIKENIRIRIWA